MALATTEMRAPPGCTSRCARHMTRRDLLPVSDSPWEYQLSYGTVHVSSGTVLVSSGTILGAIISPPLDIYEEAKLLTEAEVQRSFRRLFGTPGVGPGVGPEVFEKAESLLDELRPESPLRHRLEIR